MFGFFFNVILLYENYYGDGNIQYAYELGTQITALVRFKDEVGVLETYLLNFHNDLNSLAFEQSFVTNFRKPYQEFLDYFLNLLTQE